MHLKILCFILTLLSLSTVGFAQSSSSLQLLGSIVGNKGGVALLKNRPNGEVKAFRINENVFGVGILMHVERTLVVLRKSDGSLFRLTTKLTSSGSHSLAQSKSVLPAMVATDESYREDGFARVGNRIEVDARFRDKVLREDLPKILMSATAEPVVVGNEIQGFRIYQFDSSSMFAKLGMKEGDIVKEINGVPLTNVAKTIQFLNGLKTESAIQVTLSRNGSPLNLDMAVK